MARLHARERSVTLLESGTISVLYRPRVHDPDGIQRLLIVLAPDGSERRRVLVVGRNRLPRATRRERFWGFVDAASDDPLELAAVTGNALVAADGAYRLAWHDEHAHLVFALAVVDHEEALEESGNYIVTVANPDPAAWGLVELPDVQYDLFDPGEIHVEVPTIFPPALQARFRDRRYAQLDTVEFLEHPGAELVFIATNEEIL